MIRISNELIEFQCRDDATGVVIQDKKHEVSWQLDDNTRCFWQFSTGKVGLLSSGAALLLGKKNVRQDFNVDGNRLSMLWELLEDGLSVTLSFENKGGNLKSIAFPGSFIAEPPFKLALPILQGCLFDGRGEPFEDILSYGHHQLSMAMLGYLTEKSGLLVSIENNIDWQMVFGKKEDGGIYAYPKQIASLGKMSYPRTVRIYPVDSGLTALCKRYRRRVQERGGWKSWDEKAEERPVIKKLFGALFAFIGYIQGEFNYVEECKKLRKAGFEKVFLYPVRTNVYSTGYSMGGDQPIHLSDDEILAIKNLGYEVSAWNWLEGGIDDGTSEMRRGFRLNESGAFVSTWKLDNYQWYECCTPFQIEFAKSRYAKEMKEMTWAHFDVSTAKGPSECYALDHPGHRGYPLSRSDDLQFLRKLLGKETNGNRIISSESFRDALSDVYDIGSVKYLPSWGKATFWTVPMTMLVYHDSMVHDWWEIHNYNLHGNASMVHSCRTGIKKNGEPMLKAAMDALYGCPPNIFPFGRQYYWADAPLRKTVNMSVHFEDASVQESLIAALPVTELHRKIGKFEMLSHDFLSEDGAVQATMFSDGTRIVANFSDEDRHVEGAGLIKATRWKVAK